MVRNIYHFEIFTMAAAHYCFEAGVEIWEAVAGDPEYSLAMRCEAKLKALQFQFHPHFNSQEDMSTTIELLSETATDYAAMLHQVELISLCTHDVNLWRKIKAAGVITTRRIQQTLKLTSEHPVKTKRSCVKLLAELDAELNHRIGGAYVPEPPECVSYMTD